MKRSSILENRRKTVNPEIRESVDMSFQIVDRIHEILTEKGMKQKDLALLLGKKTIDTLKKKKKALRAPIMQVVHHEEVMA